MGALPAALSCLALFQPCPPASPMAPPPGVSLATGLHVGDLASWAQLASGDAVIKLAPALAMVLLITVVLHRVR